jgi:F-type H+-transporting ATPase subunit gamma
MQLVAASKMRRAQVAATEGRRHSFRLEELAGCLNALLDSGREVPPLLLRRPVRTRGVVLIATERGLCGALNQNTFRLLPREDSSAKIRYVAVGKKGTQLLTAKNLPPVAEFSVASEVPFFQARAVADFLRDAYLAGEVDSVEVAHPLYVNTLRQETILRQLLPLDGAAKNLLRRSELLHSEGEPLPADPRELFLEPSLSEILEMLAESFLRLEIYHLLLESKAAEQSARMVAMKMATDNAEDLAKELELAHNKARQAAITDEILEISSAKFSN